jgi:hypothetical protein
VWDRVADWTSTVLRVWRECPSVRARESSYRAIIQSRTTVIICCGWQWWTTDVKWRSCIVKRRRFRAVVEQRVTEASMPVVGIIAARERVIVTIRWFIVAKLRRRSWGVASSVRAAKEVRASVPDISVSAVSDRVVTVTVTVPVVSVSVPVSVVERTILW